MGQSIFALDIKSACNPLSYWIAGVYFTIMERKTGFEPAVPGLGSQCSTTEPLPLKITILSYTYITEIRHT